MSEETCQEIYEKLKEIAEAWLIGYQMSYGTKWKLQEFDIYASEYVKKAFGIYTYDGKMPFEVIVGSRGWAKLIAYGGCMVQNPYRIKDIADMRRKTSIRGEKYWDLYIDLMEYEDLTKCLILIEPIIWRSHYHEECHA